MKTSRKLPVTFLTVPSLTAAYYDRHLTLSGANDFVVV